MSQTAVHLVERVIPHVPVRQWVLSLPIPLRVLLLQVEDSGPGIAPVERELVFKPFYRTLGSDVDGSGLGLPIVLEIAQLHRGSVTPEDARPVHLPPGARCTVRFDAAATVPG